MLIPIPYIIATIVILHTVITHFLNWGFRKLFIDESNAIATSLLVFTLIELIAVIAILNHVAK
jgi:hypothetical protein